MRPPSVGPSEAVSKLDIPTTQTTNSETPRTTSSNQYRIRLWGIISGLCVIYLLCALEGTVLITSLPSIAAELNLGNHFVWVNNVFSLSAAVVIPSCGQLADFFGRRWVTLGIVVVYLVGSVICGAAQNASMLIIGRTIQGMGSGGVEMIVPVVIADLVPLRQRGNYMALVLGIFAVGTILGPFIGGIIVQTTTWRWIFYLNLPICGTGLVILFMFLRVGHNRETSSTQKLKRVDLTGAFLLILASVAVLIALTYGGSRYKWSSPHIIAPLLLGIIGLILYMLFEGSRFCRQPMTPLRLFNSKSSVVLSINTFINALLLQWATFFLPLYFQAILGSRPSISGVQLLPSVLMAIPGAAVAALVLSKFGKYKLLHLCGFALITVGLGLFSLLNPHSSTAAWVGFQLIAAAGSGMVFDSLLPAFQAGQAETDQAAATATITFLRCFANTWGFAIPTAIFNTQIEHGLHNIENTDIRKALSRGQAFQHATSEFVTSLSPATQEQVRELFNKALSRVWRYSIAFAAVALLLVLLEKEVPLRKELETEYGLETISERNKDSSVTDVSNYSA
ncbi:major facilitator superfamily domain-containing protein [Talaromyces proteolyticus]|uniref:Major facilitator superfamily domain-containing protein n=1 Tax=Talaromyces proteolyticus TaxID=1131652 RepID=A0AAD4KH36_9EURO|nr:major facilitator superfamily domain-containing protein [Talaromyces proteolyticus]KAH8692223.1 major facilitator superfamily domain-containing protein [Talaromyces proteolyticus]